MRKITALLLLAGGMIMMEGCCKPQSAGSVSNTLHPQETKNWCWAAVTQMLAEHVGQNVQQCDLANHRFGKSNCCNSQNAGSSCPKTDNCNTPGWHELDFAGVKFTESGSALSWDNLKKQIYCRKNPMGYAYGTPGVVGHVVVIRGYEIIGGTKYVILNDPWVPCTGSNRSITYDEYANPAGSSTHWATWYALSKK